MSPTAAVRFGPFLLDPDRRLLLRNGEPVALTPKAFDALVLLVARRDRVARSRSCCGSCGPMPPLRMRR